MIKKILIESNQDTELILPCDYDAQSWTLHSTNSDSTKHDISLDVTYVFGQSCI